MLALDAGDSLQAANQFFHDAYCNARDDVGQEIPILVLMPRELVLHRRGERSVHPYSRAFFDAAKAAAHVAVALFALSLKPPTEGDARARVGALRRHVVGSLDALKQDEAGKPDAELVVLLDACMKFADCLVAGNDDRAAREAFASATGPEILRITELATCEQIASLHESRSARAESFERRRAPKASSDRRGRSSSALAESRDAIFWAAARGTERLGRARHVRRKR